MDASSDSVAVEIRSFCLGIFFPVEKEKKKKLKCNSRRDTSEPCRGVREGTRVRLSLHLSCS